MPVAQLFSWRGPSHASFTTSGTRKGAKSRSERFNTSSAYLRCSGCLITLCVLALGLIHCVKQRCSEDNVRLATISSGPEDLQAFAQLNQAELFTNYRIESQSDNCVLFEINITLLNSALQSAKSAHTDELQIKMAKRGGACLVVETRMAGMEMNVSQDIPIKIMPAKDVEYYMPPAVPVPQVQLELPQHKNVRTVVDRLKNIDKYLFLDAHMKGQLIFRVETETATIKTHFTNLIPRYESMPGGQARNKSNQVTVKVDSKKLAAVLHLYGMSVETAIACFVENAFLVIHVILAPPEVGTATFYLPTQITGFDED